MYQFIGSLVNRWIWKLDLLGVIVGEIKNQFKGRVGEVVARLRSRVWAIRIKRQ